MARPKTPQGKRITICIKVSEEQAALIDTARGNRDRSEWGRDALLAAAERQRPPAGHADRQAGVTRAAREPESASDIAAFFRRRNGGTS